MPKPPSESLPLPPQSLEGLQPAGAETGGLDRAPIQNSPWKETSLDHPYEKPRKSSDPDSESRSERGGSGGQEQGDCWGTAEPAWETAPLLSCVVLGAWGPFYRTLFLCIT